jgi:hypothetical protein
MRLEERGPCSTCSVALAVALLSSCSQDLPPAPYALPACPEVEVAANPQVEEAAVAHLRAELGTSLVRTGVSSISKCPDAWRVMVEATTSDHPLPRLWYLELTAETLQVEGMVPPE